MDSLAIMGLLALILGVIGLGVLFAVRKKQH
jgi:nitrogen fixation-related uncharacterized protein